MNKTLTLSYVNKGKPFTIYYEHDRFINEVLIQKEYDVLIPPNIRGKDDLVVMDLGCNIGTFSLFIYDKAKKIYAIDLSRKCIELLNQTIKENNFTKMTTINQTIYKSNGRIGVTSLDETDGGNCIRGNDFMVDAITFSELMKQHNIEYIDLLKIDVEGTEYEIFESDSFKEVKDKVHVIIGESHKGFFPPVLLDYGFECQSIQEYHFLAINPNYVNNRTSDS